MPCCFAQSSTMVHSAPDWQTKASWPGCALVWAKLAFSRSPGTSRPTQLGPRMRSRYGLAASSQIGRASCRERVCQHVLLSVVAVSLKKKISRDKQEFRHHRHKTIKV